MRNPLDSGKRVTLRCACVVLATAGLLPLTLAQPALSVSSTTSSERAESRRKPIIQTDAVTPWADHELPAAKPQEMPKWWREVHLNKATSQQVNPQFELRDDPWKDTTTHTAAPVVARLQETNGAQGAAIQAEPSAAPEQQPVSAGIPRVYPPQPKAAPAAVFPQARESQGEYVLGPGDEITIRAADVPDMGDKPVRMDPDGDITLPMIGRVHAEGLTTQELEKEVTKRLKTYIVAPDVAVNVVEFRSQPVSVLGQVTNPGVLQLQGRKNLLEILSMAGGARPDAGSTIRITRRLEFGQIPLPGAKDDPTGEFSFAEVDLKSLVDGKSPDKNILIRPYDVISVPRAEIVYVIGEVGKSGPLPLDGHTMSVLTAVSSSGGILSTSAPNRAVILRAIMGGPKRAELPIDLKKIMKGQANDVPLLAGDILFVPDSAGKKARNRAIDAVVQMGTMIGTYGAIH